MENPLSIADPLPIEDIPSLSFLYRNNLISPSYMAGLPIPDQDINYKICTIQADITTLEVDAIVNAANRALRGGGGVDGAIHRAAGPGLLQECASLGGCETGYAKITDAYNLPCKKVIHAVGPIFKDESTSEPLLRAAYHNALNLAVQHGCKTIAFPAISTGVYGYPSRHAARAAISEVYAFVKQPKSLQLEKIIFCNFSDSDVDAYSCFLPLAFPPTKDDLSSAGEYELYEDEFPMETSPTDAQTSPRTKTEPAVTALSQTTAQEYDAGYIHNSPITGADSDEASRRRSFSARPEISPRHEDQCSSKGEEMAVDNGPKHPETKGNGEGQESTATDKSVEATYCDHQRLAKHDGISSHGLWPCYALICQTCGVVMQRRGTDMHTPAPRRVPRI